MCIDNVMQEVSDEIARLSNEILQKTKFFDELVAKKMARLNATNKNMNACKSTVKWGLEHDRNTQENG